MGNLTYTPHRFFDHQLYDVVLHGSFFVVTVTAEDYIGEHWAREVFDRYRQYLSSGTAVIGLAIQWNSILHQIQGNNNGPDTMQLCVGDLCIVFQLSRAQRVPQLLRRLLVLRNVTYVGIKNPHDKRFLSGSRHAFEMPKDLYDIRSFLIQEIASGNLYTIVNRCLGYTAVRWTPQILSSNWGAETLTDEQALTAATRARCAFLIARNLQVCPHRS